MRLRPAHAWLLAATLVPVLVAADANDWPTRDHDPGGRRYSPLTQITPVNVATLQPAWVFDTGVQNLQVTPLVVGGRMYIGVGSTVFALEPETAQVIWRFDAPAVVSRRGVAYWPGDEDTAPRIFTGSGSRMVALDAESGLPVQGFGEDGSVDLKQGIRGDVEGNFSLVSPPSIYKDVVITGGNNGEQAPSFGLYGDVRGWDARTGKLLWSFHTVPRAGEPGVETWEGDSWKNRSGTNMWAFFTVDVERGLVFVPLGSPTSDYYGGDRHGANLYGNSIVALDAATGRMKWYQQLVHHDLWDFDLPAAPTLIDVQRDGRTIPAVAVITKMTTLFIFDRVTGEPLFGMEERPVPQSTVPGEKSWPTQPFPLKPPPLGRTTFDPEKDFYTLTPDHEKYCRDLYVKHGMYTQGIFTPPALEGTMLTFPSTLGGGNWNGIAFDPTLGLAITNVMNIGQVGRMVEKIDPQTGQKTYGRTSPWGGVVGRFWNPENKIPCSAPPFGELIAVNVNTADIAWHVPFGYVPELKAKGIAHTGALNMGGPILTASGLIFVGATTDAYFRAYETRTGRLLWESELEASAHSIPMTFMGRDNRQYVVVAAGGGSFLQSPRGTKIVAYALPNGKPPLLVSEPPSPLSGPAGGSALPEGPGRDSLLKMCSGCHGLRTAIARRHTRPEWQTVVENMAAIGAPGTRDDIAKTVGYLAARFGQVELATATAAELQEVAGLTPVEAAAIVEFRDHEGGIASLDELRKVPGLDSGRIEQLKDRFKFGGR